VTGTDLAVPGPLVKINGTTVPPPYSSMTSSFVPRVASKRFCSGLQPSDHNRISSYPRP
jgi:hypothetical protein